MTRGSNRMQALQGSSLGVGKGKRGERIIMSPRDIRFALGRGSAQEDNVLANILALRRNKPKATTSRGGGGGSHARIRRRQGRASTLLSKVRGD